MEKGLDLLARFVRNRPPTRKETRTGPSRVRWSDGSTWRIRCGRRDERVVLFWITQRHITLRRLRGWVIIRRWTPLSPRFEIPVDLPRIEFVSRHNI